jgi:hypothetical protein
MQESKPYEKENFENLCVPVAGWTILAAAPNARFF